jgi:hypothetical protein
MGMKMQSRMMSVQNQKMAFLRGRSEYLSGGGRRKSGSSYVTCVWGKRALLLGEGALLGRALGVPSAAAAAVGVVSGASEVAGSVVVSVV